MAGERPVAKASGRTKRPTKTKTRTSPSSRLPNDGTKSRAEPSDEQGLSTPLCSDLLSQVDFALTRSQVDDASNEGGRELAGG